MAEPTPAAAPGHEALTALAQSLYRRMKAQGYTPDQMISLSSELIALVRDDLHRGNPRFGSDVFRG